MIKERVETIPVPPDFSAFCEIIDVRTPAEFAEDHLPGARNIPVLSDAQHAEVGTLFKSDQFAARRVGAAYISHNMATALDTILADRPRPWAPLVYCWRGGMRSNAMAVILRSIGWRARVLEGGYKAWRQFLRADLDRLLSTPQLNLHILGGLTGSGKTRLLDALTVAGAQVLDLEALANHRGSLLGTVGTQPSQKLFESRLHTTLAAFDLTRPIFLEAESNRIGKVHLPGALWKRLSAGLVHEITLPLEERARYLLEDYQHFPQDPGHLSQLLDELRRIRGHEQVDTWQDQIQRDDWFSFVRSILENHYDLAYRRPGAEGSIYQPPCDTLALPDASPGSLQSAAARLIAQSASPASPAP